MQCQDRHPNEICEKCGKNTSYVDYGDDFSWICFHCNKTISRPEWISVDRPPCVEKFGGKDILILVNGKPYFCSVISPNTIYIVEGKFCYSKYDGWHGDVRFAKPTHWMPIPSPPEVN